MSANVQAQAVVRDLVGEPIARRLLEASVHGTALIDDSSKILFLNLVGASILGIDDPRSAVGHSVSVFEADDANSATGGQVRTALYPRPDGDRLIEFTIARLSHEGQGLRAVTFWDVTAARQKERHLRAFARTVSSITYGGSVVRVLNLVAEQLRAGTGVAACSVMLIDLAKRTIKAGTSGVYPPDYAERVKASWDRGAPLTFIEAMTQRRTVVGHHFRRLITQDERFNSFPAWAQPPDWDTNVTVPMIVRGKVLGVLTCAYPEEHDPDDDDVAFLNAMAGQAAVAIDNALLVRELAENAALEERHRLARELHDSVSQALFSLSLQARAVELINERGGDNRDALANGLAEIRNLTSGAVTEMRALIFELRPRAVQDEGLAAAIAEHAAAVTSRTGISVSIADPLETVVVRSEATTDVYRIAQEAIHNAVKHGEASSVTIEMEQPDGPHGDFVMRVVDDGVGFDPTVRRPGHFGLSTMKERAARFGGTLAIESLPGRTEVRVVIPRTGGPQADSLHTDHRLADEWAVIPNDRCNH